MAHSNCPRCGEAEENKFHVLQCRDPEAQKVWNKALKDLKQWMTTAHTSAPIRDHILAMLKAWADEDLPPEPPFMCTRETTGRKALQEQNQIGAWNMVLGRLSKKLEERQDIHFKSIKTRRGSGRRWTVELIKQLQDLA